MKVKIFWKQLCPKCPQAKQLGKELEGENIIVEYNNIDEVDGLAEATYYDIMATPSIIVADENNREIAAWRGEVPPIEEIKKHLKP